MLDLSRLSQVDTGTVEFLNFILLQPDCHVVCDKTDAPIIEINRTADPSFSDSGIIAIVCDTPLGLLAVALDVALIDALGDRFIPGWDHPKAKTLPFEWRAIATLEKVVQLTAFAAMPCRILSIERPTAPQVGPDAIYGTVRLDGADYGVGLVLRDGNLVKLESYIGLPETRKLSDPADFPVKLQPTIQGPTVTLTTLEKMTVGAAILLPSTCAQNFKVSLKIDENNIWLGTSDIYGNFTLTETRGRQ